MRWVAFRQRRRTLSRQHVNAAGLIRVKRPGYTGALAQRDDARHHTRRHFRFDMDFAAVVENTNAIAIDDAARLRIDRIDPHLLTAGCLQDINVAIS